MSFWMPVGIGHPETSAHLLSYTKEGRTVGQERPLAVHGPVDSTRHAWSSKVTSGGSGTPWTQWPFLFLDTSPASEMSDQAPESHSRHIPQHGMPES